MIGAVSLYSIYVFLWPFLIFDVTTTFSKGTFLVKAAAAYKDKNQCLTHSNSSFLLRDGGKKRWIQHQAFKTDLTHLKCLLLTNFYISVFKCADTKNAVSEKC